MTLQISISTFNLSSHIALLIFCLRVIPITCVQVDEKSLILPPNPENITRKFHNPNFYPNRTGIVQLFQWPFKSIARECEEFLGPRGFAGVQTSPVHETRIIPGRPWYELYQPISYKINNRLGNEKEFINMVKRCNRVGVRIYIDALPNHMCDEGETLWIRGKSGSKAAPKYRLYPEVPYGPKDFHEDCITTDWTNKTQCYVCKLLTLPDLDQSRPNVRQSIANMMNYLLDLGVAGFRIDAASFMDPKDLKEIYKLLKNVNPKFNFPKNTKPFLYHEAHSWKDDYTPLGRTIEFAYAFFIAKAMRGNYPLKNYHDVGPSWGLVENNDAVVDNDNHDSQRSYNQLTYRQPIQFKMATAYMLAFQYGIPKMMSSFAYTNISAGPPADSRDNIIAPNPSRDGRCKANWNCEHRYKGIADMVEFANIVEGTKFESFWGNNDGHASFCRGQKGFIAFNSGKKNMSYNMYVCLPPGTYCDIATGEIIKRRGSFGNRCNGKTIFVDRNRRAHIQIGANDNQKFLAIHIKSKIEKRGHGPGGNNWKY